MRASRQVVLLAVCLVATPGCSLVLVKGPPSPPGGAPVDCTDSRAVPVVDLVAGGVLAAVGVGLLASSSSSRSCTGYGCVGARAAESTAASAGPVFLGTGLLGLLSSAVGFQRTSRCREVTATRVIAASTGTQVPKAPLAPPP